jgi:hypothetical protein
VLRAGAALGEVQDHSRLSSPSPNTADAAIRPTAVVLARGQSSLYEKSIEIGTSQIPHAGNGVFTRVAIPKGAYLGACTGGLRVIDRVEGNAFTRMNYAPAEFRNVRFEKICEAPFVKIVALREIAAGEELWVDYGPRYHYDFMPDPAVIRFFDDRQGLRLKTASGRAGLGG